MLVFIHDNFKLDLTYLQVTFTEQNQWFKDTFSTEISFPFDLYLDSELSKNTGFDAHYNANQNQTIYEGYLDKDGELINATLTFKSIKGKTISALINAGLTDFPSFKKKLSELDLEIKPVDDIIEDAVEVIKLGYPATNYNYGMIHTDKYDVESSDWKDFGKIINQYKDGAFVLNELDSETNIDKIKNIIQPMPYLMHVVKKGIEAGGHTLAGDILTDPDFNRALVWRDGNYYQRAKFEEIPFTFKNNEYESVVYSKSGFDHVQFLKQVTIAKKGDYNIFGSIYNLRYRYDDYFGTSKNASDCSVVIYKNNTIIYQNSISGDSRISKFKHIKSYTLDIDFNISVNVGDIIKIRKIEPRRDSIPSETPDYPEAISLKIIPVRYRNPDESPIISLLNLNEVNLTKVVPDLTFRDVITALKNWKNYDFIANNKVITMNLIERRLSRNDAVDISDFEIEEPEIEFHEDREFELAFTDAKANASHLYDSVLVTKSGVIINEYATKDTTSIIKIDALPLPSLYRNGVTTAYSYDDEPSKLRLVFMSPVADGGSPICYNNENVLIPKIVQTNFLNWLNFRINSNAWKWDFLISVEKWKSINIQTLIYAYGNYHLQSEIEKERIDELWWRITAKTESLL